MALLDTEGFLSQTGKVTMALPGYAPLLQRSEIAGMIDFARKLKIR